MNEALLIYGLLGVIAVAGIVLILAIRLSAGNKAANDLKVNYRTGKSFQIYSYHLLCRFLFTKKYLNRIRSRIEMLDLSDQWTVIKKTMNIAYCDAGLSTLLFLLVVCFNQKVYGIFMGILSIYIIHNQLVKLFVDRLNDKLLIQLEKLLGDIRHHYHVHGMVDDALYDSLEECGHEISGHVMKMYEVLTSEDIDESLSEYYDLVPDKFFKSFLALCYTVQRFGDRTVEGKSVFLSNLNYLKQEINLEILKRRKLNYLFQSLAMISVTPIFTLSAIQKWAESNMKELKIYYRGPYGFIVQMGLFVIVLLSFELINKLQSRQVYEPITDKLEGKLLKIKVIRKIIYSVINRNYSKSKVLEELIKKTGLKVTVEGICLKRILYAIMGFAISLIIIIYAHELQKHNLLYTSYDALIDNNANNQMTEREIIDLERHYVLKLHHRHPTYQMVEEALMQESALPKNTLPIYAKRILDKTQTYDAIYFKWWELLISIIISSGFYYLPYWILLFKKYMMYLSMEDEVMQFHTIILMLMHIERISVEELLEWMSIFSVIFKESLDKCLNNFEQGDYKALEQLKLDEPFLPLMRIVENLQAASDKIAIDQAFDELKIERAYYQEKRKQDNEMILNKKGTWGKIIAFIPLTATVLFYLITPFIHLSITQFINYSNQIKDYL